MHANVNTIDRIIRLVLAMAAGYLALASTGALAIVLWLVAGIMIGTAAVGFCPLYRLLGISTRKG